MSAEKFPKSRSELAIHDPIDSRLFRDVSLNSSPLERKHRTVALKFCDV